MADSADDTAVIIPCGQNNPQRNTSSWQGLACADSFHLHCTEMNRGLESSDQTQTSAEVDDKVTHDSRGRDRKLFRLTLLQLWNPEVLTPCDWNGPGGQGCFL